MSVRWPDQISFKSFCQQIKQKPDEIYTELFVQHEEQFSIKNRRLAINKLQKIFESTFALANDVGFQAMTLRQLSNKSGLSMGGMYAYIKSKDDLAQLIYSFLNHYCNVRFQQLVSDDLKADKRLIALIHSHIYLSELMQPWFYFAYMETKNLSQTHKALAIQSELEAEQKFTDVISDGIKQGYFKTADIQLTASLLKAMLQDWYLKHGKYKKRKIGVDSYAKHVVELTMGYLQGDK